jgi:hypothetical protein
MKIRTTESLIDILAADISWRRRELTDLRWAVQSAAGNRTRQDTFIRAAVALLYAHWEGFVKLVAERYLEFVSMQRHKNSELASNVLAVALRSMLQTAEASKKIGIHIDVIDFFREQMDGRSALPYRSVIRTEANLSSPVLLEIIRTIGISPADYEMKSHLLDNLLLAKRNHIAHGAALDVEPDDYFHLHDEILGLMNLFRTDVENAAVTKHYLKH